MPLPLRVRSPGFAAAAAGTLLAGQLVAGRVTIGEAALPLDDSWIHLELARHLAEGFGMAYEPGTQVAASTAPLWTAFLAIRWSVVPPVLWSQLLGAFLLVLAVLATGRLARVLEAGPLAVALSPWIVATTPWLLWSGLSGMEVPLVLALSVGGLALHHRALLDGVPGDRRGLALLALAPLARPEALLLLGLALADRWTRLDARGRRFDLALVLLALGPTAAAYSVIGGSPLPTTLAAKASGGPAIASTLRCLRIELDVVLRSLPLLGLAALPGLLRGLGAGRRAGLAAVVWPPGLVVAYAVLTPGEGPILVGNFGRYLFPILPLLALFGLAGLDAALPRSRSLRRGTVMALVAVQVFLLAGSFGTYTHTLEDVRATDVAAARWLAEHAPPDLLVGAQDVGAVGYLAPQRILGLVGIVEPEIRPLFDTPDVPWPTAFVGFLERRRPDLLVVFRGSYPFLPELPGFRIVARFHRPENRTMAGTELLILRTPWSRWVPETPP